MIFFRRKKKEPPAPVEAEEKHQPENPEIEIVEPEAAEPEPPSPEPADDSEAEKTGGWMARLRSGLGKTARKISAGLADVIGKPSLDAAAVEAIEDTLIMADLGMDAASRLVGGFSKRPFPDGVNLSLIHI